MVLCCWTVGRGAETVYMLLGAYRKPPNSEIFYRHSNFLLNENLEAQASV